MTKINLLVNDLNDKSKHIIEEGEKISLENKLVNMKNDLKIKNILNKAIDIITEFKEHIFKMEKIDRTKTSYTHKIREIF